MSENPDRGAVRAGNAADAIAPARQRALGEIDGIVGLMHESRKAIGELQTVLSDLLTKAGGGGGDREPLALIGDELGTLVESLGRIANQLGADRIDAVCVSIRSLTRDIVRSGLEFQMVAKLTAITVASLPSRSPELETYAESFGDITQRLSDVSLEVEAQLGRIVTARGGAVGDFAAACAELRRLHEALASENERGRASASRKIELEIGAAAGALQECTRTELGKLVGAIQFADAFAQRAEHVGSALALAERAPVPRARALRRVAVALSEDLIAGMRSTSDALRASVERLRDEGASANALLETRLDNGDLEAAIVQRERNLSRAAGQLTEVGPRIDAIERRTGEIEGLGAAARKSLNSLVHISRAIMVSAVNAGLIASRISSSGGPLTVLAAAAQSQALGCSRRIEECTVGVIELIATMEGLGLSRIRFELDAVTGTAERLGRDAKGAIGANNALSLVAPRIAAVVGVFERISVDLAQRLAGVEGAMASFDAAIEPVRAGDRRTGPLEVEAAELDDLRGAYTMQSEREIHDRVFGVTPKAAASSDVEEFDDVLF